MQIDALQSPELLATIRAIKVLDRTLKKMIRRETKRVAVPEWKRELAQNSATRLENRVLVDTAVVTVSDRNVRLQSATKGRMRSGGFDPKTDYYAAEWGVDQSKGKTTYSRVRKGGKPHKVTRHTTRQLRPRNRLGYVVGPARKTFVAVMGRLWVQTTVRTIATALEGKQE